MSADDAAPRSSRGLLLMLLVAQLMATMDGSIVGVATKTIQDDLNTTGAPLQLILSGYTLMFGVLVVTGARLGNDLGHRRVFLLGLAGFIVASVVCGIAPNAATLVAGRVIQGAFGALMVPQVLSLIQVIFTGTARARAIGLYSMVLALGVGAGQIVGGLVVGADLWQTSWRAAFLINLPIGVIVLIASASRLPRHTPTGAFKPDLTGILMLALSMAAIIAPVVFGREQGWPAWALVVIVLGFGGLAAFMFFEHRLSDRGGQPVLDVDALRPPGVKAGLLACCILNFAFAGIVFPMTLHMQNGLGYTPLQAGLAFVPMPIGFAAVSLTWTRLPKRFHPGLPLAGLLLYAVAVAGMAVVAGTGWSLPLIGLFLFLAGAGMAAGFSTLVEQIAATVGPRYAAAISALVSTGTLLAAAVAVAVIGGIYIAVADSDVSRSGVGLARALAAVSVTLVIGLALGIRTWRVAAQVARAEATAAPDESTGTAEPTGTAAPTNAEKQSPSRETVGSSEA
jgi:MFS family permease